ncbi:hypothetical protein AB6A40_005442 [Gnathostoma spinigerum]|uniref:Uncharacterized protein n=1 Tax=Gnathostoma spinigerum TaxID=75299 RepID=A0ABD6EP17_9BILA
MVSTNFWLNSSGARSSQGNKSTPQFSLQPKPTPDLTLNMCIPLPYQSQSSSVKGLAGDIIKWKEFYQGIQFAVGSQLYTAHWNMTKLTDLVRGPEYRCVAGLQVSDNNYPAAPELLQNKPVSSQQIQSL